jgi:hypothetical protein
MSKSAILLESINTFFDSDPAHFKILEDILTKKTVSLRNLEKFVTNFSKDNQTTYKMSKTGKIFSVHIAYKSSLCGYSKKFFDPFCRTDRIEYRGYSTTIAQLNFIKWCIQNEVITNIEQFLLHPQMKGSCTHNNRDTFDSSKVVEELENPES